MPVSTISPLKDASAESPCLGGWSHRRDGEVRARAPLAAWVGHLGGASPSAPRRRLGRQAPCENGSPTGPLEHGEPPTTSSSPRPSHERRTPVAAMKSLPPFGEATMWMTPTCHSSPPRHWARHLSTSVLATGLHLRRCHAPLPSAA
jgi:hypothetical protein